MVHIHADSCCPGAYAPSAFVLQQQSSMEQYMPWGGLMEKIISGIFCSWFIIVTFLPQHSPVCIICGSTDPDYEVLEWMRGLCLPFRGCNGFPSTVWLDPSTYIEGLCLCFRSVERFDPREGLWTQIPAMGSKRGSLSATVLNGKL
jgi:hypothetical protein